MRILLADDSLEVRLRLRSLLCEMPSNEIVGEAGSVSQTLDLVSTRDPEVLILDLGMPDGSGFEVLERLRGSSPRPRVVVLTNYADAAHRRRSAELGATCLLDKSKDFDRLGRVLETLRCELGEGR